jgi:hypothetical protein
MNADEAPIIILVPTTGHTSGCRTDGASPRTRPVHDGEEWTGGVCNTLGGDGRDTQSTTDQGQCHSCHREQLALCLGLSSGMQGGRASAMPSGRRHCRETRMARRFTDVLVCSRVWHVTEPLHQPMMEIF